VQTTHSPQEIRAALRLLCGETELPTSESFEEALRTAFRRKARDNHPDRARTLGVAPEVLNRRLVALNAAYALLQGFKSLEAIRAACRAASTPTRPARPAQPSARTTPRRTTPPRRQDQEEVRESGTWPRWQQASTRASQGAASPRPHKFYEGPFPRRSLRFAEYLYYSRYISWETLLDAVAWQRRSRPRLGELALRWGWLDASQVQQVLREQLRHGPTHVPFAEQAVALGLLTRHEQRTLLARQKALEPKIGSYFVARGVLSADDVEAVVRLQTAGRSSSAA